MTNLPKEATLITEFNYAENVPLPRLNVCDQFDKRFIWICINSIFIIILMVLYVCIHFWKAKRKNIPIL